MSQRTPVVRALILPTLFGVGGLVLLRMVGAEHVLAGVALFVLSGVLAQFTVWFLRGH